MKLEFDRNGRRLVQDDDGHWYLIPIELMDQFDNFVDDPDFGQEDNMTVFFGKYQVDGPHKIHILLWEEDR